MDEAIEAMNGTDLDRRHIIVEKAQPQGSGDDQDGDCSCDYGHLIVALIRTMVVEVKVEMESA